MSALRDACDKLLWSIQRCREYEHTRKSFYDSLDLFAKTYPEARCNYYFGGFIIPLTLKQARDIKAQLEAEGYK